MSAFDSFYGHKLLGPLMYFILGFSSGIGAFIVFNDEYDKHRDAQKEKLESDVQDLKDNIVVYKERVESLQSSISAKNNLITQQADLIRQRNDELQTMNLNFSKLKSSYDTLSQYYQNLGGSSTQLQSKLNTAQQNCSLMTKINQLELEKKNLVTRINDVSSDVFNTNKEVLKADLRYQLQQNHERLMGLQEKLNCS